MRLLLLAYVAACTTPTSIDSPPPDVGNTPDAGEPPDALLDPTSYCEVIAPFFRRFYLRCGRIAAPDDASCRYLFRQSCEAKYEPKWSGLAAAHLLEFHSSGVLACEHHLDAVACDDQLLDLDGPCAQVWRGTQPEGSQCGFDTDAYVCAPGTRCVLGLDFCGSCQRLATAGEPCGLSTTCPSEETCVDGACVHRPRRAEPCGDSLPPLRPRTVVPRRDLRGTASRRRGRRV